MNLSGKLKTLIICFLFLFAFKMMPLHCTHAYYSGYGLYGGAYGLYGGLYGSLYGGTYGGLYSGLYGGLYGNAYSLYGGLYGMYGGLYGSTYGLYGGYYGGLSGMYGGLYGMYGGIYGGLYGGSGLYGGLYGSSYSLYGGYYGGLYGGLYGLSSLRYGLAEQAGTWDGFWSVGIASGPLVMTLVADPVLTTSFSGTFQLVGNEIAPNPIEVIGNLLNNQIIFTGTFLDAAGAINNITVSGILTSLTEMSGNYTIIFGKTVLENGAFEATLTTPVI